MGAPSVALSPEMTMGMVAAGVGLAKAIEKAIPIIARKWNGRNGKAHVDRPFPECLRRFDELKAGQDRQWDALTDVKDSQAETGKHLARISGYLEGRNGHAAKHQEV